MFACAARVLAVLGVTAVLSGCVSQDRERELGDMLSAEINAQLPLLRDPLLHAYVNRLGQRLAGVSDRPDMDYHFYIINTAMVNAFALPGGHVYLTRGLIERTRSGPELAGVLAHEVGHVAARHGVEKLERHLRTGSLMTLLYQLVLGREPELLRQNSLELAGVLWNARHSREDEEEADRLAVEYLVSAGVDPHGVVTLLEALMAEEEAETSRVGSLFSTHPMTATRIEVAQEEIRDELGDASPRIELQLSSYPAFLRRVENLPPPPDALESANR